LLKNSNFGGFLFSFFQTSDILPGDQISGGRMRGDFESQPRITADINLEKQIPQGHPLRKEKGVKRLSFFSLKKFRQG